MSVSSSGLPLPKLRELFGERLQENVRMANYTSARVGGEADALLVAHSAEELADIIRKLWDLTARYMILGSGANVLFADAGFRGVVVLNRAHNIKIDANSNPPGVVAESGANLGMVARQAALRGLSGLEWAAIIPGTVGGAVYGNAGAFGGDMNGNLILAEILHPEYGKVSWSAEQMQYGYRTSILKRNPGKTVILAAHLRLEHSTRENVQALMQTFSEKRKSTQPPGASMGSMFKNPVGDYAGRLIESAGLKGTRIGGVEVSPIHANFFVNDENATASDYWQLIQKVRTSVYEKTGIQLELEVEIAGDWGESPTNTSRQE